MGKNFFHAHKRESGSNPEQYPLLYSSKQPRFCNATVRTNGKANRGELSQKTCQDVFMLSGDKAT
jgi:hypothetical protein